MHINIQPITKFEDTDNGATLLVHSIFHTIQGEGPLTGHPAIFIRLGGCNLQCPQCDTDYTVDPKDEREQVRGLQQTGRIPFGAIVMQVERYHAGPRLVVITGGEPFRQNISSLCLALLDMDYQVQVETNGTLPPPFGFPAHGSTERPGAWVVVSPKAGKVHPKTAAIANAWKYVLNHDSFDPEDGLPIRALDHTASPRVARPPEDFPISAIYLQPADRKDEAENAKNLRAVIRSCMRHGYTLQLQVHKILNME